METVNNNPEVAKVLTLSLAKPLFVFIMPLGLELVTFGWETGRLGDWEHGSTGTMIGHYSLFTNSPTQSNSISTERDRLKQR